MYNVNANHMSKAVLNSSNAVYEAISKVIEERVTVFKMNEDKGVE